MDVVGLLPVSGVEMREGLVLHAPSGAWAVRRSRAARAALVTDKS